MVVFQSIGTVDLPVGRVFLVRNDRDTENFGHLIGSPVIVDGQQFVCARVERYSHAPPWRKGEKIGLLKRE